MSLFLIAGIYFFARGVFGLFGSSVFYTRRILDRIEDGQVAAYLKQSGWAHILTGFVFVSKGLVDTMLPQNFTITTIIYLVLLLLCLALLAKCDSKYMKK